MDAYLLLVGGDVRSEDVKLDLPTTIGRGKEASITIKIGKGGVLTAPDAERGPVYHILHSALRLVRSNRKAS